MVGELVKRRRLALRLTQTELGKRAGGLTQDYISKLERGTIGMPQRGTLEALAGPLGLEVEDFFRAAGILGASALVSAGEAPVQFRLFDDEDSFAEQEMVDYVVNRPGRHYQERVTAQRRRLAPADFRDWCIDVFNAFRSNSNLALRSLERGEERP